MLTNLLSVIRGVSNKGTCIVELGQHATSSQQWGSCCICGTTISDELHHCDKCWQACLASDNWADLDAVDDCDLVLEPIDDSLYLGDGIDLDAAWDDAQLALGYRAV